MKICVSSYSFTEYIKNHPMTYPQLCDLVKEMGFDGIEFVELDAPYLNITKDCMAAAREIREHCAKIGLEVVAYTVGANLLAEDIEAEKKRIFACVDVAAEMGAKLMRHDVCAGPRPDVLHYNYQDAIREMAPHIREITEYAQRKGVKTCTENHGRFFQAPERVEALIRAVGHPNYGWLLDVGNFMGVDADVVKAVGIGARYAFHVHFKDNIFKPGTGKMPEGFRLSQHGNYLRATVIGHGDVPVEQCIRILKLAGYDGFLNVEYAGPEDNLWAIEMGQKNLRQYME